MISQLLFQARLHWIHLLMDNNNIIDKQGPETNIEINRSGCLEHDVARNSQVLHWHFSIPRATPCSRYLFIHVM